MGSSSSKISIESLVDVVNENLTDITNTTKNQAVGECTINQNLYIKFGPESRTIDCGISGQNVAGSNCNMEAIFSAQSNTSLVSKLNQAIDNSAESTNKVVSEALNMNFTKNQTTTNLKTHIKNLISTKFTDEMSNTCIQKSKVNQDGTFIFEGYMDCRDKNINIGNVAQIAQLTSCVTQKLMDIMRNDETTNDIIQSVKTKQETESKGLQSIIDSLTGPIKYAIIAFVIVILIVIIGATLFLLSPAGQKSAETLSEAGAKKLEKM